MNAERSRVLDEPSRRLRGSLWQLAVAVWLVVAPTLGAQEATEDPSGPHPVIELRIGIVGATPTTVVHRGAREGPTADAAELWTEVEGAVVPIGLAIGILDPDDKVLGVRLFQAADEGDAVGGDAVVGTLLIEPGVDGEADIGDTTYVVHLVDVRREPISDGSTAEP